MKDKGRQFLVVAGEASGDIHGSGLVNALKDIFPDAGFSGLGGNKMRSAGVKTFFDIDRMGTVGVVEILGDFWHYWKVYRTLADEIASGIYTAVILIDYPTLNLRLAKLCKKINCPVFFFISPQVWAWRKGRLKAIRRNIDKMFVVFPFEESMYAQAGVDAEFLGHPFVGMVRPTMARDEAVEEFGLVPGMPTIGLLPGSRRNEIDFLLGPMIEAGEKIKNELKECQFILPIADTIDPEIIQRELKDNPLKIKTVSGKNYDVMNCCDYLIIASGSATLEAGMLGCPMVIVYKLNWITYWLARLLLETDCYGLINIVAGERVVPELIQSEATPQNIAREALSVLNNPERHQSIRNRLLKVQDSLGQPGVMQRIAERISEVLHDRMSHEKISI